MNNEDQMYSKQVQANKAGFMNTFIWIDFIQNYKLSLCSE